MALPSKRLALLGFTVLVMMAMMKGLVEAQESEMPACGADCLARGLTSSSCDPTDPGCVCADQELQHNVSACVVETCTIKEALTSRNISSTVCHQPIRDISYLSYTLTSIFMGLAVVATLIRCTQFTTHFGLEDVFALLTFITALPMGIVMYFMSYDGYGRDIWTIPFDNITHILKLTWIEELFYIATLSSAKLTFLTFYLRLFPHQTLRRAIFILMATVTAFFLAFFFGVAFNCVPVSYIWTKWSGEGPAGKCLDFNSFGISCAVINIVLDIAVLGLPLQDVAKMRLSWTRKVLVMLMLGTGVFVTIVSILRLKIIIDFARTTNPTYDNVPTSYWSIIEIYTAVVCLNMPSIRRFFKTTILPRCKTCTTTDRSTTYYYYEDEPDDNSPVRVVTHPPRSLGRSILSSLATNSTWKGTSRSNRSGDREGDGTSAVQLVEVNPEGTGHVEVERTQL